MKLILNVRGSESQAIPLIIQKDLIYVHTNIHQIEVQDLNGQIRLEFEYDETQYEKDEYIQIMAEKNISFETQLTDVQIALCEIYEGMV